MDYSKPKRPRKPLQAIKVIHRPKTWFEDDNRSEGLKNTSETVKPLYNESEFERFYQREIGRR